MFRLASAVATQFIATAIMCDASFAQPMQKENKFILKFIDVENAQKRIMIMTFPEAKSLDELMTRLAAEKDNNQNIREVTTAIAQNTAAYENLGKVAKEAARQPNCRVIIHNEDKDNTLIITIVGPNNSPELMERFAKATLHDPASYAGKIQCTDAMRPQPQNQLTQTGRQP